MSTWLLAQVGCNIRQMTIPPLELERKPILYGLHAQEFTVWAFNWPTATAHSNLWLAVGIEGRRKDVLLWNSSLEKHFANQLRT